MKKFRNRAIVKNKKKITIQISNTNIKDQIPTNFFNHFTKKINDPTACKLIFLNSKKKTIRKKFLFKTYK